MILNSGILHKGDVQVCEEGAQHMPLITCSPMAKSLSKRSQLKVLCPQSTQENNRFCQWVTSHRKPWMRANTSQPPASSLQESLSSKHQTAFFHCSRITNNDDSLWWWTMFRCGSRNGGSFQPNGESRCLSSLLWQKSGTTTQLPELPLESSAWAWGATSAYSKCNSHGLTLWS